MYYIVIFFVVSADTPVGYLCSSIWSSGMEEGQYQISHRSANSPTCTLT